MAVLACVQLAHGLTFGLTQVGTMGLLVRHVPAHVTARGQGYLAACSGIIASSASILSGAIYAHYGQGVYYLMAAMAGSGATADLAGAAPAVASSSPQLRAPADRPGCRHSAARHRDRAPAAADRRDR